MITKPRDREVVCHASAWDVDNKDDLRIKMCTLVNATDFVTVHHELGHNFYQRAYNRQPFLYLGSANDGFHEAIGDMIALSVTPEYLVSIGLLEAGKVPDASRDIGLLLRQALEKVPGMAWTVLVDKWRWGVFDGSIAPDAYNKAWNDLRREYMGVVPPVARSEEDFDPGPNSISRATPRTRAISSHACCSSSSTSAPARSRAGRVRCTAARSTATARSARSSTRCSRWAARARGPMRWRPSPAPAK